MKITLKQLGLSLIGIVVIGGLLVSRPEQKVSVRVRLQLAGRLSEISQGTKIVSEGGNVAVQASFEDMLTHESRAFVWAQRYVAANGKYVGAFLCTAMYDGTNCTLVYASELPVEIDSPSDADYTVSKHAPDGSLNKVVLRKKLPL